MDYFLIRAIERILVVIFAGISIILGWHLFKIGVVSPQNGSFVGKGFNITLQKVGPGIFFSLFGSIILSVALINGIEKEKITNPKDKSTKEKYRLMVLDKENSTTKVFKAINTLKLIRIKEGTPYSNHIDAIEEAISILNNFRDSTVRKLFKDEIKDYEECRKRKGINCKENKKYKEISECLESNLL